MAKPTCKQMNAAKLQIEHTQEWKWAKNWISVLNRPDNCRPQCSQQKQVMNFTELSRQK